MADFSFGEWKNKQVDEGDAVFNEKLEELVVYILGERKKGKIPLIIAGAGASANDVAIKSEKPQGEYLSNGLPCLSQMIWKLRECVISADAKGEKFCEFKELFEPIDDKLDRVDREWLGKVFTFLEESSDEEIKNIWNQYCNWFFFECIEHEGKKYGALNTETSRASEQIAKMYDSLGAICLSANFDNFINFALINTGQVKNGIPIFDRQLAEKYFKRNRRGKRPYEDPPYNQCVLHANGDVFWLFCSGEKGEGYCPETGKKVPAFTKQNLVKMEDLKCEFCKSSLAVTMTMPGTYEKDYNTREIITTIWKYISTKISAVITVGLSCNWDDVLLKFILQLIKERSIPLLDINDLSDKAKGGKSNVVEKVVKESHLESCAYITTALKGTMKINEIVQKNQTSMSEMVLEKDYQIQIKEALESTAEIQRLRFVSQLGLKSYWLESEEKNERWSHSEEVANIAVEMYKQLCKNSCKKRSSFEEVLIYTAGLLHDCGHLPFSHLLEDVFEELSWHLTGEAQSFKHGHHTKLIIQRLANISRCRLSTILEKYGISTDEVIKCIEGNYGVSYIDAIINSAIDADKIAYIFTDAENAKKSLALTREEFLRELLKEAYITQEGLIALDGKSAWYAMRLLDERTRMYEELYYDVKIRFLEAAVKYIITTYFVQKYNDESVWEKSKAGDEDLGNHHILMAIEDLYKMLEGNVENDKKDLSTSISEEVQNGIEQCMKLVFAAKKCSSPEPKEIKILEMIYLRLMGKDFEHGNSNNVICNDHYAYLPVRDAKLEELVAKLDYNRLNAVRKKIVLNYPGTILIDIYMKTRYFSSPSSRREHDRIDGTNCGQEMILIPKGEKELWLNQKNSAEIGLLEYSKRDQKEEQKVVFHVYKIGSDEVACNHAINMLKKELASIKE